ncbi:MAG: hypothetical protein HWN66_18235 [Candidatus Helarchaeota archaeon]|nr:hypothetical protein [Candidatus Helarchaeota archaeon]
MVEQFSSFVQEALEFLSLLRASEKERFAAEQKFMTETTKLLKELAESIKKNNVIIKTSLDDFKQTVNHEIKKIEEKVGIDMLNQAIKSLETSVDLLQRGSTMLDYKFTIQKTRDLLDELRTPVKRTKSTPSSQSYSPPHQPVKKPAPSPQSAQPVKKPAKTVATPKVKRPTPPPPKGTSASEEDETPSSKGYQPSVAAMMGTRSRSPRRAIKLKPVPRKQIVEDGSGEPIEIETGSDEDE